MSEYPHVRITVEMPRKPDTDTAKGMEKLAPLITQILLAQDSSSVPDTADSFAISYTNRYTRSYYVTLRYEREAEPPTPESVVAAAPDPKGTAE